MTFTVANQFDTDTFNPDAEVSTINYEGLNLWWQMQNLPTFMKAW